MWIDDLRSRLNRGDRADLPPIDRGHGALATGDLTARVMLADDHLDWLARHAPATPNLALRRHRLVANIVKLREWIV